MVFIISDSLKSIYRCFHILIYQVGFASRDAGIPDDFRGNLNPGIKKYFPGIPGIFNFLKYKFFDVINEVFVYNLYKSTKKMIDFKVIPGIPRIPED